MLLLLPLRALAGDAMTLEVAGSNAAGQVEAAMPADCPMVAGSNHGVASDEGPTSCCDSCDLCVPLAEPAAATVGVSVSGQHVMRPAPAISALDVPPLPSIKPPIS